LHELNTFLLKIFRAQMGYDFGRKWVIKKVWWAQMVFTE
jgi:hypothetical protein